ncbi:MAG: hypothetical protein ACYTE3_32150 [Planctomycetota bacterium]|jgi:hypothetical protein
MQADGFWAVEIDRDGTYEFALRRWPKEASAPINSAIKGGKAISVTRARIKIADVDQSKPVDRDAIEVVFRMKLKAGKTKLQTWFTDDDGASRGAYYVYARRI